MRQERGVMRREIHKARDNMRQQKGHEAREGRHEARYTQSERDNVRGVMK